MPADKFGFAATQTVFEGANINTDDKPKLEQARYRLMIPFGHDVPPEGEHYPTVMQDYRTGGTPWFIIIDPAGKVVVNDFHLDADLLISAMSSPTTA